MTTHPTTHQHTAARGALVVGASWSGLGMDSRTGSRRGFKAFGAATMPVPIGGVANTLFALAGNGH